MTNYICQTCGTQFGESMRPPSQCPICQDERQYVGWAGQRWTTFDALRRDYRAILRPLETDLVGIGTNPDFAIGQRALLIQSPGGNILWDCVSLLDAPTIASIKARGGISAIAISHPHFYTSMVEWSRVFDAPIYLHAADREWVMRPDLAIRFWEGDRLLLWDGISVIRCGGHFPGSSVLHWPAGAEGRGALLTGDTIQVVPDRRFVSFMYSYPNLIPLRPESVRQIVATVEPLTFDRIYGGWWDKVVQSDANQAVRRSAARYLTAMAERRAPGNGHSASLQTPAKQAPEFARN